MARILIADDAAIMRKNLRMILTKAGHTVVAEASNGSQAYDEYAYHRPDLVTLDINMPFVNGIDAMKKILRDFPDGRIIVISSSNSNHIILEAIQNGAKNYIMKPFMVEKIINVVNQTLQVSDRINSDTVQKIYKDMEGSPKISPDADTDSDSYAGISETQEPKTAVTENNRKPTDQQFSIEIKSNTFVISIDECIDSRGFTKLYAAMQSFLLVRPLKLVLNLQNSDKLNEEYLEKLVEYINSVKAADGAISLVAQKEATLQFFKNRGIGWFTNFYTHMSQVRFF